MIMLTFRNGKIRWRCFREVEEIGKMSKSESIVLHFRERCRGCGDMMDWSVYADEEVEVGLSVLKKIRMGKKVCVLCEGKRGIVSSVNKEVIK